MLGHHPVFLRVTARSSYAKDLNHQEAHERRKLVDEWMIY